jgi:hypothetical protein
MLFLRAIGFSVLFGIGGLIVGAIGASIFAAATSMPSREGGPGFFAIAIGIFAGFAAAVGGFIYALSSSGVSVSRIGWGALAVVVAIGLSFATFRFFYTRSQAYLTDHYGSVTMQFEILMPAAVGDAGKPVVEFFEEGDSEPRQAESLELQPAGDMRGAQVLAGIVYVGRVTSNRSLRVKRSGQLSSPLTFPVDLPRFPANEKSLRDAKWSGWANHREDSSWRIRYRVVDRQAQ